MPTWYLYIIKTRSGSLYTGITTDINRRFAEHQENGTKTARFLRGKGPLKLVHSQKIGSRSDALKMEYKVKKLKRAEKEKLIRGKIHLNPTIDFGSPTLLP